MRRRAKYVGGTICICAILAVLVAYSCREAILWKAGKFMAPEATQIEGTADVVILEGTEFIKRTSISKGLKLWSSGKAKRIAVVLHRIPPERSPFAFDVDYPSSVRKELLSLGVKDSALTIIVTSNQNPITLMSAKDVVKILSKDDIRSAILVSPEFHMRRSFLVYQRLCAPLKIKVYPLACFDVYEPGNWWKHAEGPRDFLEEVQKLAYYLAKGYIPLRDAF
jgi:uncharacterized SAM-binding protein YcdF (DUF218 family)